MRGEQPMRFTYSAIISAILLILVSNTPSGAQVASPALNEATGLVLDMGVKTFSPALAIRIVDENGKVVYGDLPELTPEQTATLIDRGMATFAESWKDVEGRCGKQPLVVKSLGVIGDDIRVSLSAAQAIRDANNHHGFLNQNKVCVISSDRSAETGPDVAVVGPQLAAPGESTTGPKDIPIRQVPIWKKFKPGSQAAQKVFLVRMRQLHPRLAARIETMQRLTPQERKIVREFFPYSANAHGLTPEERKAKRQEFRQKYPALAHKLREFFQERLAGNSRT
jgi:hypothetical protein